MNWSLPKLTNVTVIIGRKCMASSVELIGFIISGTLQPKQREQIIKINGELIQKAGGLDTTCLSDALDRLPEFDCCP
jgi:hypothetical protein